MTYFILSLIIGLSAALLVWVVFVVQNDLSPNTLKRLEKIKRKSNAQSDSDAKYEFDMSLENVEYKFQAMAEFLRGFKFAKTIKDLIQAADVELHVDTFIFLSLACAAPFLIFLFTHFKLMALFSVVTFFIPTMYLKQLVNKRFADFSKQFPDALNLMSSSLRAGHPLIAAVNMVAEEMPKPISAVFETTTRDISLGVDTKDAFYSMTRAMPQSIDLRFFVTAVLIQKEVGGNLAELLDSLSITIRERFKLLGQLRVLTAQTKLSGTIIGFVPPVVLLFLFLSNREYIKPLFDNLQGQLALTAAIVMSIVGAILIKKISDIEM
jgi:tight adherence protein B